MYGALLDKTGIHRGEQLIHGIYEPMDLTIKRLWDKIVCYVEGSEKRISVEQIYEDVTSPRFGAKLGYLPVILTAIMIANRDSIALYEHGTYCRKLTPEIGERLVKNPGNFEIKHIASGRLHQTMLDIMASKLKIGSKHGVKPSVLDIVGRLAAVHARLEPYAKNTKQLCPDTIAVRDAIAIAREPDTLLFESIPDAFGIKVVYTGRSSKRNTANINQLAERLAHSVEELESAFVDLLYDMRQILFEYTGINNRAKLAKSAFLIKPHILNKRMEVFLTALSNDVLDDDDDWIKYVALTVTGIPPADWTDEQRNLFINNLRETSNRFLSLASMYFSKVSDNFQKPSYKVTVTRADGEENSQLISIQPDVKTRLQKMATKTITEMKKKKFTDKDIETLAAMMLSDLRG